MTDTHARVWPLGLYALVRCALTGPVVALRTPLAHTSSPALNAVAAALAAALVGAYVALTVLLIVAVLRARGPARTATTSPPRDRGSARSCGTIVAPTGFTTSDHPWR